MPRYRATENNTNLGLGHYAKGAEFEWLGWPRCIAGAVEPANQAAERVLEYWNAHRHDVALPQTPFSSEHGRILLPHHLPADPRSTRLPGLPRVELDGMPRWRAEWQQSFGGREVKIGDEFAYCGWPVRGMTPVNDAARQVVEYFEANAGNPRLLSSPWDDAAAELFLPALPEPKKGPGSTDGYARDCSDHRDPWNEKIIAGRLTEARAQLHQASLEAWAADVNQERVDRAVAQKAAQRNAAKQHKGARRRVSA